jgi:heat-inducible transcriptional repressor
MLSERRTRILNLVAESYIASALPVPSSRIADRIEVSSATVRNEFSALEQSGYLQQPHTSAGRIPTPQGFQIYAHCYIPPRRLPPHQRSFVEERLIGVHGDGLLQQIANVTAELTGYAVVVSLPADETLQTLEVHLALLSSKQLLAVIVMENGLVRQLPVTIDPVPSDEVLNSAERSLRQLTLPVNEVPKALLTIAQHAEEDLSRTLSALANAWSDLTPSKLFSQGLKHLFTEPESRDPGFMKLIMEQVEEPVLAKQPDETPVVVLDEIVARITTRLPLGSWQASLKLVGPARMRYPDALMVVRGVSEVVRSRVKGHNQLIDHHRPSSA